jgi:hypothetical protein
LPAAYRGFGPIGGDLCKKQPDLLFPSASISLKRDLKATVTGFFSQHYSIVDKQ